MMQEEYQPFDRTSKWLIQHHGDSILRMAIPRRVVSWRSAQAEVVQPRQLPDGLLDVRFEGEVRDDPFLLEIATYPERRANEQLTRDLMLVYLDRGELPEGVTLVLRPKGRYRIPRGRNLRSRHRLSSCSLKWHVVELWTVPADDLWAIGDIGLVPWIPLADSTDPPEQIAERCRQAIEQDAPTGEKENLLAVTQVLTFLRYNDLGLMNILGGTDLMIESPLIQQIVAKKAHEFLLAVLETRFGAVPPDLIEEIQSVDNDDQLIDMVRQAAVCRDLDAFRAATR